MDNALREKVLSLLTGVKEKEWQTMKNDIERYQKIKELIINAFRVVLEICPQQVRITILDKINKMEESDPIFEFEELEGFISLAKIFSTSILSSLDEKKIKDYAIPHQVIGHLDSLTRVNEKGQYSESNVCLLGASISVELEGLKARLEKMDWKEGWGE